jgi:protein-tyrosine phosphatase
MVLSLIDTNPMRPGWGRVYQSGVIASESWDQDGLIISMSGNENFEGPCLWRDMPDNEVSTLPDEMLFAFVDAAIAFLRQGKDVLIHCNEGKYRSTYMDVAVHVRGGKMSSVKAYEMIKAHHPIACLREGTDAQLRRLESKLKGDPT